VRPLRLLVGPCDRGQTMLMPPDLTEWVPDDHVVWSILGAVDQMDLLRSRTSAPMCVTAGPVLMTMKAATSTPPAVSPGRRSPRASGSHARSTPIRTPSRSIRARSASLSGARSNDTRLDFGALICARMRRPVITLADGDRQGLRRWA
jgi:hypothetical protein